MIGEWAGPATFVVIASYILVYGSITLLLSVWSRADAVLALLLVLIGMVWDAVLSVNLLGDALPGVRELITFVLPPQGALEQIETAFGLFLPIPWGAFLYVTGYAAVLVVLALVSVTMRER
jgi:hypothetical protein